MNMKTITRFTLVLLALICLPAVVKADEVLFTTLPQPAQTTVIRETHIVGPTDVVRVIRENNGLYAVTVRKNPGEQIVYVNGTGQVMQPIASNSTVIETTQAPDLDTFVHNLDSSRYQLIEKKEEREVYLDKLTGTKWVLKIEKKD
jgi:hypothetical protein